MLREILDKFEPTLQAGRQIGKLYPLYEANDTFLYTPGEVAKGGTHIRDAIDTKRMMSMVIVALLPCIFMAFYNTGYQAEKILAADPALVPERRGLFACAVEWFMALWRFEFAAELTTRRTGVVF